MTHLFLHWNKLKDEIRNKFLFLFLDYDGTLTPIIRNPDDAILPKKTKEILRELSKNPYCKLTIISGRALKDMKNIIGLEDIIYVGNHGLEIEGPRLKFKSPVSLQYKIILKKIKDVLTKKLSNVKGAFIEDKGLSLTLHYRLVDKKCTYLVKTIFHETIIHYLVANRINIKLGKKVLEVIPPLEWNKGKAVLWLLARLKFILGREVFMPMYIGDDITDEDAFKVLKNRGLGIFIGEPTKTSSAKYYLRNSQEVSMFLKQVLEIKINIGKEGFGET